MLLTLPLFPRLESFDELIRRSILDGAAPLPMPPCSLGRRAQSRKAKN
jgi:hypothetical protein